MTTKPTPKSLKNECRDAGLKILARREHSATELRQKLAQKLFDAPQIEDAITWLIAQNYQSDARFAADFIQMRFNQGKGSLKIAAELKQRGIAEFTLSGYDFAASASRIKIRKYGANCSDNYQALAKQKRFLQSRGFNFDDIHAAFQPE